MDFFAAQDNARRSSLWLVLLFVFAMCLIIAVIYLVFEYFYSYREFSYLEFVSSDEYGKFTFQFDPVRFGAVAFAVAFLVLAASMTKVVTLRIGGGAAVATSLGGALVPRSTRNPGHRKLINIVDEMAIASGISPPQVYVLPDSSTINAFAAGYRENDAVIGVTQGAVDSLTRDELQGVIAHEYSHIINGDMRLNMRLMGIVFGISVIGYLGYVTLRNAYYLTGSRDGARAALLAFVIGITLTVIGFLGVLVGNIIRASISRQREYLADASAVQYTRNPQGIGNALVKLAKTGGRVEAAAAAECSHMLFEEGTKSSINNLMASHPPIDKRIKRVLPDWDGAVPEKVEKVREDGAEQPMAAGFAGAAPAAAEPVATASPGAAMETTQAVSSIGNTTSASHAFASEMLSSLPPGFRDALADPFSARAVVYALLLDPSNEQCRQKQVEHLSEKADPNVFAFFQTIQGDAVAFPRQWRLPLAELCLPALRDLTQAQTELFMSNMNALIDADDNLETFEWCLHTLVVTKLPGARRHHGGKEKMPLSKAAECALSTLAKVGGANPLVTFDDAVEGLGWRLEYQADDPDHDELRLAFMALAKLNPRRKEKLITAATKCATGHGSASINAVEMLRVFSSLLDCPMPPLDLDEKSVH